MKFEKFPPSAALLPFVREFMIIETDQGSDSKIIPDTSIVMAFRYRGYILNGQTEKKQLLPVTAISGLRKSARLVHYSHETANLLVILNEAGITAFSRIPAHELFNQSIDAENLFSSTDLNDIIERLAEAKTNSDRIAFMEAFLLKRLIYNRPDLLVGNAIQLIKQQSGMIRIKELATSLYISQDAFEKRFRAAIGSSAKQYSSIIRLRNLIKKYPSYSSLTDASYEAGYFDQSHFIKDFRQFTGQTPKGFFKSPRHW